MIYIDYDNSYILESGDFSLHEIHVYGRFDRESFYFNLTTDKDKGVTKSNIGRENIFKVMMELDYDKCKRKRV